MSARRARMTDLFDAAYAPGGSDAEWLGQLSAAANPELGVGLGIVSMVVSLETCGVRFEDMGVAGAPAELAASIRRLSMETDPRDARLFGRSVLWADSASDQLGKDVIAAHPAMQRHAHPFGVYDSIGIGGREANGRGVVVCICLPTPEGMGAERRRPFMRLAEHLLHAYRLRRSSREEDPDRDRGGVEAVFHPDGRLAHADPVLARSPANRALLSTAVAHLDRARATELSGGTSYLDVWRGLVAGRWTLVDVVERDGRRFVMARRNDAPPMTPLELTPREREVLWFHGRGTSAKEIAFELQLAYSTVATVLGQLRRTLGSGSACRLGEIARAYAADHPTPPDPDRRSR